jgi:hypothetical protein
LLQHLRRAREDYELETYGRRERYWNGLTNRWNNSLAAAQKLLAATTAEAPPMSSQIPKPIVPGSAEPPAIPFYKSGVLNLSLTSVAGSATAIFNAWRPGVPWHQQLDVQLPLWLALFGGAGTAFKRVMAEAQPLTLTQKAADEIVKEKAAEASASATAAPASAGGVFHPVPTQQALPPLTQLPLEHLARELPLVVNMLMSIVPAIGAAGALVDEAVDPASRIGANGSARPARMLLRDESAPSPAEESSANQDRAPHGAVSPAAA